MARKRYNVNILSQSSIRQLKRELNTYSNNLSYKCQLIAQELARLGCDIAKVHITTLDAIFTGELISSITSSGIVTQSKAVFYVIADSKHACFVEFGTGQLGQEGSYPYPFPEGVEWKYNSGKTIFEIAPGEYGWFYPSEDGWKFTQGMPARPFMYETSLELYNKVIKVCKEAFRK